MLEAPIPPDEVLRLETLRRLSLLDSEAEERFDRLTRMARRVFNVPIALVSLVDEDRQWFKSCIGLEVRETARDISFCGHAIMGNETFIVPDAGGRRARHPLLCWTATADRQRLQTWDTLHHRYGAAGIE